MPYFAYSDRKINELKRFRQVELSPFNTYLVDNRISVCYTLCMSIKEDIYRALDSERGKHFSGEELAQKFGVSRNAVWKAVKALKREGLVIEAGTNRGYVLQPGNDLLTPNGIKKYLDFDCSISVERSVGSTNDEAKKMAADFAPEWSVVFAEEQTAGRGRYSRPFYSPQGAGLYVSILLRPKFTAGDTLFITTSAAVAVCEAIESVSGKKCAIKWVNDVFMGGKKVCGILTEASFDVENGKLSYAIVGIGINVRDSAFPQELKGIATSVFGMDRYPSDTRAKLAAKLLERFRYYYERIPQRAFYEEYKRRSFVIGKEVDVYSGDKSGEGTVLDLEKDCSLRIRYKDGKESLLVAGEVSVKPKK